MAKKKRKRTTPGGRSPGGGTRTAARPDVAEAPAVKPVPATPGGPNRLERKEAARRARETLRRRMARRRFYRRGIIAVVLVAAVGGIVWGAVLANRSSAGAALNAEEQQLLSQATQATTTAGCGEVQTVGPYPGQGLDNAHLGTAGGPAQMPPLSSYPSIPPASGPHNPTPLGAGVYPDPPPIDQVIHSLEHGAVAVWYSPDVTSDELARIQTFFAKPREQTKVIVAPYDFPDQGEAGALPQGKQMALVAWHHLQLCDQVSLPVAYDFVAHYRVPTPEGLDSRGDAPEPNAPI